MAESNSATNNSTHLDTNIESGRFDEKESPISKTPAAPKPKAEDEDEDEDIDALIEDLESQDGHGADDEEVDTTPGGGKHSSPCLGELLPSAPDLRPV